MTRNAATFIALGSPSEAVLKVLEDWLEAECGHKHVKACIQAIEYGDDSCDHAVELTNLHEVAVRIADMIERGELS